ncbi:MAG: T9SS type A sorting domain-containing protein, partial [Bacteroidota bacterium]
NSQKQYFFTDKYLSAGKYLYRLKQIDRDGKFSYSQEVEVTINSTPKEFALKQNYPNPFNPATTIEFTLAEDGFTTLKIYDMLGREVSTLVSEELHAGILHHATFDASNISSGLYFYRLETQRNAMIRKLVLMK